MQIGYCSEVVDAFISLGPHSDTIELARKLIDEIQSGENHALIHPTYLVYQLFKKDSNLIVLKPSFLVSQINPNKTF